jgi:hypothetical protein
MLKCVNFVQSDDHVPENPGTTHEYSSTQEKTECPLEQGWIWWVPTWPTPCYSKGRGLLSAGLPSNVVLYSDCLRDRSYGTSQLHRTHRNSRRIGTLPTTTPALLATTTPPLLAPPTFARVWSGADWGQTAKPLDDMSPQPVARILLCSKISCCSRLLLC